MSRRRMLRGWLVAAAGLLLAAVAHAHDTVYYYSSDSVHSEVVITDANRNVVERTYYAPYGQVLNRSLRDGPGYTGHEEDPETSLVYMQQRYYDPQAGRFLSTDPVPADGNGGSFNRYEYAKDNPYRYTDPFGMCTGSHITSQDGSGTCASTGGYTTGTNGAMQGMVIARARQAAFQQIAQREQRQGRQLTEGESKAAHSEFPDLNTDPVRIKYNLHGNTAFTPNNTMHFPQSMSYCHDFSSCDHGAQIGWFIHEVTHVWQYQNGINPIWGHIFSKDVFSFGNYLPLSKYLNTPSPAGLSTEKQADWHMWHYECTHDLQSGC